MVRCSSASSPPQPPRHLSLLLSLLSPLHLVLAAPPRLTASPSLQAVNRKRKADQLGAAPTLARLESEWVGGVKKNIEIEAQCLRLEAEVASLKDALEAKRRAGKERECRSLGKRTCAG